MASNSRLPSARRPVGGASKTRPMSMIEDSMLSNLPALANVCSDGDTSKKSKRRSLLPQFNRKASGEEKPEAGIKEEDEDTQGGGSRPTSEDTRNSGESVRRRAIDEDRKAMPPPPSRLSRPVSMIPPRGASQFARTHQSQAHTRSTSKDKEEETDADADSARAASLAALTGGPPTSPSKPTMAESGLKRSGSSRLPQSPRVGGMAEVASGVLISLVSSVVERW